jgi:hypothetical protein
MNRIKYDASNNYSIAAVTFLPGRCLALIGDFYRRCRQTHRHAVETGLDAIIYIPSFVKIGSGIQKLMGGYTYITQWSFQNKKNMLKNKRRLMKSSWRLCVCVSTIMTRRLPENVGKFLSSRSSGGFCCRQRHCRVDVSAAWTMFPCCKCNYLGETGPFANGLDSVPLACGSQQIYQLRSSLEDTAVTTFTTSFNMAFKQTGK